MPPFGAPLFQVLLEAEMSLVVGGKKKWRFCEKKVSII